MAKLKHSEKTVEKFIADNAVKPEGRRLTHKQIVFAKEYAKGKTGLEAARIAGYSGNDAQLSVIAAQNLGKLNINTLIEQEKRNIAQSSAAAIPDKTAVLAKIADIANDEDQRPDIRLKALDMLARYHSIYNDRMKIETTDYANSVQASRARLASVLDDAGAEKSTNDGQNEQKA